MAKILIVDDDPILLSFYVDLLKSEGHEVDQAVDGEEGFHFAQQGGYDLLLLDVNLPKRDGLSIVKELKKEKIFTPQWKDLLSYQRS